MHTSGRNGEALDNGDAEQKVQSLVFTFIMQRRLRFLPFLFFLPVLPPHPHSCQQGRPSHPQRVKVPWPKHAGHDRTDRDQGPNLDQMEGTHSRSRPPRPFLLFLSGRTVWNVVSFKRLSQVLLNLENLPASLKDAGFRHPGPCRCTDHHLEGNV